MINTLNTSVMACTECVNIRGSDVNYNGYSEITFFINFIIIL